MIALAFSSVVFVAVEIEKVVVRFKKRVSNPSH